MPYLPVSSPSSSIRPVCPCRPLRPSLLGKQIIAVAAPIDMAALSDNRQVILIEQGQAGRANAQ